MEKYCALDDFKQALSCTNSLFKLLIIVCTHYTKHNVMCTCYEPHFEKKILQDVYSAIMWEDVQVLFSLKVCIYKHVERIHLQNWCEQVGNPLGCYTSLSKKHNINCFNKKTGSRVMLPKYVYHCKLMAYMPCRNQCIPPLLVFQLKASASKMSKLKLARAWSPSL